MVKGRLYWRPPVKGGVSLPRSGRRTGGCGASGRNASDRKHRGFTLIELLVVLAVVATLLTLAVPRYFGSIDKSKEAVLKENLYQLREAISRYHADKGKYPDTLESLATDRYLRTVPLDPITESKNTWIVIAHPDAQKSGVYDVRSGSPAHEQW